MRPESGDRAAACLRRARLRVSEAACPHSTGDTSRTGHFISGALISRPRFALLCFLLSQVYILNQNAELSPLSPRHGAPCGVTALIPPVSLDVATQTLPCWRKSSSCEWLLAACKQHTETMIHLLLHAPFLTPEPSSVSKAAAADCLNTLTQEPSQSSRCSLEDCKFFADALWLLQPINLRVPTPPTATLAVLFVSLWLLSSI